MLRITRVCNGADGVSHFVEADVDIDPGDHWTNSLPFDVEPPYFRRYAPPGASSSYQLHPAHAKQFMVMVSGEKEIEVGDGTVRRFRSGDVVFMEDTAGSGHITRTQSDDRVQLCLPVAENFDFDSWANGSRPHGAPGSPLSTW